MATHRLTAAAEPAQGYSYVKKSEIAKITGIRKWHHAIPRHKLVKKPICQISLPNMVTHPYMATCCCNQRNRCNRSAFSKVVEYETTLLCYLLTENRMPASIILSCSFSRRNAVLKQTTRQVVSWPFTVKYLAERTASAAAPQE